MGVGPKNGLVFGIHRFGNDSMEAIKLLPTIFYSYPYQGF